MPVNIPRLRSAFAVLAIALVAIVALVYLYGRWRVSRALNDIPKKIGVNVQQSTAGFSLCRSEAGRTVFCINASKAVQYKQGGKAALKDVSIVVYGREANRFDQIYGSDFEYDPSSGEVSANGEVHIDLQAYSQGPVRPDQAPPAEIKNPIHLKTSGLSFNQKTGVAQTHELIDFRVPQASGSAVGATYDAHAGLLKLLSKVRVTTGVTTPATITAGSAEFTKDPREAHLEGVHVTQQARSVDAGRVTVLFRDDDHVDRVLAQGDVRATNKGPTTTTVSAPQAEFLTDDAGMLRTAAMTGGVTIEGSGASTLHGRAERITMDFAGKNVVQAIHAAGGVDFSQPPRAATARAAAAQGVELATNAVDFQVHNGRTLAKASTPGPGEITLTPSESKGATTAITAASFRAGFDPSGHLESLHGSPDAKITSSTPGQPQQVSTSRELEVAFGAKGGIVGIVQTGDVRIADGQRTATAQQAVYEPGRSEVVLTGGPRVAETGFSASADTIRVDRRSGDVFGDGAVKTTYTGTRASAAGGGMLGASDPVHVTAQSLVFHRNSDTARFTGQARLWQGANVVEAPVLDFDRQHRTLVAHATQAQPVTSAFVEQTKTAAATPVNVTSAQLTYSDTERKARFSGGVTVKGADATVTANEVDIFLLPKGEKSVGSGPEGASQLDRIEATGDVKIRQPNRQAQGDKLVYVASEGKFVLTGGPPSIFDAEHGTITGDSLTFYNRDDRVLIESSGKSRTVTQTRVKP